MILKILMMFMCIILGARKMHGIWENDDDDDVVTECMRYRKRGRKGLGKSNIVGSSWPAITVKARKEYTVK